MPTRRCHVAPRTRPLPRRPTQPRGWRVVVLRGLAIAWFAAPAAHAHQGVTGVVKERMDAMTEIAEANKVVRSMVRGERSIEAAVVRASAARMQAHARALATWFPDTRASRHGHKTEALPAIWERWDDFEAEIEKFERAIEGLMAVNDDITVDSLERRHRQLSQTCRTCHKSFRRKKRK